MKAITLRLKNPETFATNSVRYFVANDQHIVERHATAGEDICQTVTRNATIEVARDAWKKFVKMMRADGYTQEVA